MPFARHYALRRAVGARAARFALAIASLTGASLAAAQPASDESGFEAVRAAVATALGRPSAAISFEGLRLVRDKLGSVVCGTANGKRFIAGPSGKPPPQIEGTLSAPMFNYLWNARCQGMSASAADEAFGRESK